MIPFIDLQAQYRLIGSEIEEAVLRVLRSGNYILGAEVERLEAALAEYTRTAHAVSCASGTDALLIALMAKGIGPGDAIITTPFTFFATAEVIALLGAVPVFADIEPAGFNIDPAAIERALSAFSGPRPRGIIAVDLFGLTADYRRINAIAAHHGLFVIEDAAQSFGAQSHGKRAGALAEIGCTSFFPAKPLGACGDGGALFTDDVGLAELFRSIRVHGQGSDRYENVRLGITGRLDALQAAALLPKLRIFPGEILARQRVAADYDRALAAAGAAVARPVIPPDHVSAWAQYCLLAHDSDHRGRIIAALKAAGIPTAIYYPKPLHLQGAFARLGHRPGDFPVSENIANRIFAVPMHPYLEPATIEHIARVVGAVAP